MQYKAFISAVLFSAMTPAMAQNTGSAMPTDMVVTDVPTALPSIPTSIVSVLMTAVPQSAVQAMGDPASRESLFEQWQTSKPSWYKDLPSGVKSYLSSMGADMATATDMPTEMPTGMSTMTSGGGSAASETGAGAETDSGTGGGASMTGTTASGTGATASGGNSTSTGGAPAPTGPVAAGLAGAAGILGLAAVL